MKWAALDVSQHAPHVDWQMTLLGEYHARFDDGHWARVYFAPVVDEPYFALEVWQEELVWVWDTCPDLARLCINIPPCSRIPNPAPLFWAGDEIKGYCVMVFAHSWGLFFGGFLFPLPPLFTAP